jgi:hypothetical protein
MVIVLLEKLQVPLAFYLQLTVSSVFRDNCQCPLCFEASSKQRIVNLAEFDIKVNAADIKVSFCIYVHVYHMYMYINICKYQTRGNS